MKEKKLSGLFINCVEAKDSIFESGKMVFECLSGSAKYSLDYCELSRENRTLPTKYDFYFFNYHMITMKWLQPSSIKKLVRGIKFTMVLEVGPNNPFAFVAPEDFDGFIVLDPTVNLKQENVFAFPRPLESNPNPTIYQDKEIPVIGSFGFATPGKGFEQVIEAINYEFEKAVVRINIPYGDYTDEGGKYAKELAQVCKNKAKKGIEVQVTHDFMSKAELIKWCGQNTLNCFLYDRNVVGLAATTDQAISSGRPLITSKNETFRHIHQYIKPYPEQTLKEAIKNTKEIVERIQKDWSAEVFRQKFEDVLDKFQFVEQTKNKEFVKLKLKPKVGIIQKLRNKLAIKTRFKKLAKSYRSVP